MHSRERLEGQSQAGPNPTPPRECCCAEACSAGAAAAALHYAQAHAFRIAPVLLDPIFQPVVSDWPQAATVDGAIIERWWQDRPLASPAVATGAGSGLWVMDVDVKGDAGGLASLAMLESEYGDLKSSWVTRTPSGGLHLWFSHPLDRGVRNIVGLLPGIDIRGDGGLIVLPPAQRAGRQYVWLTCPGTNELRPAPQDLLNEVTAFPDREVELQRRPALAFKTAPAAAAYISRVLEGECATVAATAEGGRNDQLFRSSARIGQFVAGNALSEGTAERNLEIAALSCGLEPREAARTIQSGLRRGASAPQSVLVSR